MPRQLTVDDWQKSDVLDTGNVTAVGWRPQRIAATEPFCLNCKKVATPVLVRGRWDAEGGHTAIPFEPVFVRMSCGCEFGTKALALPTPDLTCGEGSE